ncbi:hydroxyacylglutathione hydrolase [Aureococcus anophagefferens]|nr:hydroxyacylglutathione hydrolase [Aureococcus anophagefferens]
MGETSDKENEQNEKERKKEMAEFRKIAKQLKAKDAQTKLGAIAKCGENAESLRRGECFVPLLQLCVAKKKNAAIVAAAVGCVRGFLAATAEPGEAGDDGEVSPPSHAHARLLLEAAEKKKNRVPGGKLFTDLLSHENPDIVGGATGAYRALVACARAPDASKKFAAQLLGPACEALAFCSTGGGDALLAVDGGADAVVTLAKRLAETSDAAAGPPKELLHCLNIVERLLVAIAAEPPPPTTAPPDGGGAAAAGPAPAPAPGGGAAAEAPTPSVFLSCDKTTGALYGALKFFGDASAEAVPEGLGDCVALVCKCLDRSVDAFKEDAYRRLTASPEAAVPATLLKVLVAPARRDALLRREGAPQDGRLPRRRDPAPRGRRGRRDAPAAGGGRRRAANGAPRLDAAAIAAALAVDDADGKYRAIRFAAKLSDRRENALILTPVVAPLLAVVEAWAADAQPAPWPTGISNEAGAALALDGLIAIAGSSAGAWAELADDAALAVWTRRRWPAARASGSARAPRGRGGRRRRAGPGARARGGGEPAGEAPPAAGAAPRPSANSAASYHGEAVAYMWEPTAVGWETSFAAPDNGPSREVGVRSRRSSRSSRGPPPAEARPAEAAEAPAEDTEAPAEDSEPAAPPAGKVTATTATTVLALATVDLTFDDAPYWGKAAHDDDELLREDLRSTAMELLAAVAANGGGREPRRGAAAWAPAGAPAAPADAPPPDVPAAETAAATDPEAGDDGEAATPAAPAPPAPAADAAALDGPTSRRSAATARGRSDQPVAVDKFAAAAVAMGALVPLAALASARTALTSAAFFVSAEDAGDGSAAPLAQLAADAEAVDDEPKKDDKKKGKKDDKKAKDKGRKSVVEKAAEENPDEPPPVFDEAAAAAAAAVAAPRRPRSSARTSAAGRRCPRARTTTAATPSSRTLLYAFVAPDGAALDNALDGAREATDRGATPATLELAGDAAFVAELLEAGADVNVAVGGRFPLHWAIEGVVLELAHDGIFPCVFGFDAENRSLELVDTLVAFGAHLDRCDEAGATPLHSALRLGACGAATALLKAGAEPNLADAGGRLPLHLCGFRCGVEGMGAVFEALLAAGATRPRGTATYDNARAGTSRAAKMRATVGGVLDRAFAVAVAPPSSPTSCPWPRSCWRRSTPRAHAPALRGGRGLRRGAAAARRHARRRGRPATAPAARAVLAALLSRGDVSLATQSLGCAARGGAGVVHLAVEALGDFAVPALEAARAKGADLDELLELPEEDMGLQLPGFHPPEPGHDPTAPHCASPTMTPSSAPAPAPEVVTFDIFDTVPSTDDLGPLPPAPAASAGPAPAGEHAAPAPAAPDTSRTGHDTVGSASNGGRVYTQALPELPPTARRVLAPIHVAVRSHAVGVVDWLLERGAAANPCAETKSSTRLQCAPRARRVRVGPRRRPRGHVAGARAARGHAHTVVAMDVGDALDKNGRTTAMVAALAGRDDTVEELLDHGVHAYVRDCGGMNLLDVAIDLAEVDVATSIIQHAYVQVYERDVRRAERVHCFWADKAMAVTRDDRAASHEAEKLTAATAVLKLVLRACWAHLEASRHIKPCFADGVMYYDVLLAEEQKAIDEAEQEHAARSIQFAIKRRNKKKAKGKGGAKKKNRKPRPRRLLKPLSLEPRQQESRVQRDARDVA